MAVIHVFVFTAADIESHVEIKTKEDLYIDTKLCNLENELSTSLQEVCEDTRNCDFLMFYVLTFVKIYFQT